MKIFKKICLFLILTALFAAVLSSFVLAQEKELEVQYPEVPGAAAPTTIKTLPQYVKYIFNFGIWIGGLIAFLSLVYGGVRYLTSAGDPSKAGDAREQIFAGILGLIILLTSYLILYNLNPQILTLKIDDNLIEKLGKPGEVSGVWLCQDDTLKQCAIYTSNSDSLVSQINGKVGYIHFQNTTGTAPIKFGAVLHENNSRQGTCKVFTQDGPVQLPSGKATSITVFHQSDTPAEGGVTLYECGDFRTEPMGFGPTTTQCQKWPATGAYQNEQALPLDEMGRSIEIKGKYLTVLYQFKEDATGECEVLTQSDPDLTNSNNHINKCGTFPNWMACFRAVTVLPIK